MWYLFPAGPSCIKGCFWLASFVLSLQIFSPRTMNLRLLPYTPDSVRTPIPAGKDAEGKTGDGVGILLQISHKFFSKTCKSLGIFLGSEREYGIGMFFFPQDELKRNQAKKMFEIIVEKEGLELLGWRAVPTVPEVLGH